MTTWLCIYPGCDGDIRWLTAIRPRLFHSQSLASHLDTIHHALLLDIRLPLSNAWPSSSIIIHLRLRLLLSQLTPNICSHHLVFAWYTHHSLPVTPINPGTSAVTIPSLKRDFPTSASLSALSSPKETSVSIITPPAATLQVLREARELGVPAVWMQPGSFDADVLRFAREDGAFQAVVAGEGGRGEEGWCVLVDGERGLRAAGKL